MHQDNDPKHVADDRESLSLVKKNSFTTVAQIKNIFRKEVGANNREKLSPEYILKVYHKSQRVFKPQNQDHIRKKNIFNKVCSVLEKHPMNTWQLVPEWWKEKSMEKGWHTWSKAYHSLWCELVRLPMKQIPLNKQDVKIAVVKTSPQEKPRVWQFQ